MRSAEARIASALVVLARRAGRRRPAPRAHDRDLRVVVRTVDRVADDVVALTLAPAAGTLPRWRPGAHVDVVLPSGMVRQYSLCGEPGGSTYRIAVRRLGTGSREVHALAAGARLVLRGPRTAFPWVPGPSLFLAGGIGITPLLPMARAAAAAGVPWRLVHTGRTRASLPLSAGLDPARVRRRADDEHGGPAPAAELLDGLTPGTAVYCCGPPAMIEAVRAAVPAATAFHAERFSPPPVRDGRPFTVRLADGTAVPVPADGSALDAVRAVVPGIAYSCRQGFCGTCHVPLRSGTTVADTAAPGRTALCVARAAGTEIAVDVAR